MTTSTQDLALLIARVVIGAIFIGHGTQKLFGWFGGYGIAGTGGFMESIGIRPGKPMAALAGLSESLGGLLLLLGLGVPLASLMLAGTMLVAILKVTGKNGPWASKHGFEYDLVLLVTVIAIAVIGPGNLSIAAAIAR